MKNRTSASSIRHRAAPLALATAAVFASVSLAEAATPVLPTDIYEAWAAKHPLAALASDYSKVVPAMPSGATIPVTNCNNSGAGSLRAAIVSANSGDTIDLSNRNCTITLTSGEIAIPVANLTISGPGADQLTIDGDIAERATTTAFSTTAATEHSASVA